MDINELLIDPSVGQLRIDIEEKYEKFQRVCSSLSKLISNTVNQMGDEFLNQSKEFFNRYNFDITTESNNNLNFKNELSEIKLEFLPEEEIVSFNLVKKDSRPIYRNVKIQPEFTKEDMIYWKININELTSVKSVSEALGEITDVKKLKKLLNDIQVNIDWYSETVEKFDDITYIYADAHSDKNIEYKNFDDFFNNI